MLRNYFLLNLLLILIIGILGFKLYNVLVYSVEIPSEANEKEEHRVPSDIRQRDKAVIEGAYDAISKLDLFRPSRSASLVEEKKEEKVPLSNPPKLFGTVILGDNKTAILEDPDTKVTKVYRINDSIAGYTVSKILEDKVILIGNGDEVEVKLREEKGVKPPRQTAVRATNPRQIRQNRATRQQRTRPVPPRRRPTRVRPRVNTNPAPQSIPESVEDIEPDIEQE